MSPSTKGTDPVSSFQLLNAALGEARSRLPADTKVDARLLTSGTFPIIDISLSSQVRNLAELTDIAQYDLVPSLHRIAGVYRVETVGAKYREYVVRLDPARMLQHKLTPQDVVAGLAKANVIESAGRVLDAHRMLLTVVTTDLHGVEQLAALPIANVGGQPDLRRATSAASNSASSRIISARPPSMAPRCWSACRSNPTAIPRSSRARRTRSSPISAPATPTCRSHFPTTRRRWSRNPSTACATRLSSA